MDIHEYKMLKISPNLFFKSIAHCRNHSHCPCQKSLDQVLKQMDIITENSMERNVVLNVCDYSQAH